MRAYKFLQRGAIGPISGFRWPTPGPSEPGAWSEAAEPAQCQSGVHVCRVGDLAHWIHDELWEIEVDGEVVIGRECLIAPRGRLVRRIDEWSEGGAVRFARACTAHARELCDAAPAEVRARVAPYVGDSGVYSGKGTAEATPIAALCAAVAVAKLGGAATEAEGYDQERAWQSSWIARELGLRPG